MAWLKKHFYFKLLKLNTDQSAANLWYFLMIWNVLYYNYLGNYVIHKNVFAGFTN